MDKRPIGIFDSGVGGLSIWREITRQLPYESTIYIADSANCPYGDKSKSQIYTLSGRLIKRLVSMNCKLIVVACNTVTVTCLDKLRNEFGDIPIVGIVPVIKTAAEKSKNKKIGVLSTPATASSLYQKHLIEQFANGCEVVNIGTEEIVELVENGNAQDKIKHVLEKKLAPFIEKGVDTLALGCSHFPFLINDIKKIMGEDVLILDSSGAVARQVGRILKKNRIYASLGKPSNVFLTSGDPRRLKELAEKFDKKNIADKMTRVEKINE